MRRIAILLGSSLLGSSLALAAAGARAATVEDLMAAGYSVVRDTAIKGQFDGCEQGAQITLADGGVFVCSGYGHMYARNPKAVVLKNGDHYKLLVNGAAFDGRLA